MIVRFGEIGLERERFAQAIHGLLQPALIPKDVSQAAKRFGEIGLERQRFSQAGGGIIQLALLGERVP